MTCQHDRTEPVTTRDPLDAGTGPTTVIGHICVDCPAELPVNWGCPDCQWVDATSFCDPGRVLLPGMPCPRHARPPQP